MNSKWPAIHQQASMAKATKLFLSSVILLLYTSLDIQGAGAAEYGNVTKNIVVQSMKKLEPQDNVYATQRRVVCAPCHCCPGNSSAGCYATNCCIELLCNGPREPIGTCTHTKLACNCSNCQ
ncbi:hypothetical protein BDA96_08G074500 [Sorghum bicolor]|uniref:DUF7866 domain-containing protein n=1 Tax=Sorghum bicolor TaxID=4558 RepID=A0A921QEN0_SORBI|nr:hypothetical protein BDA96_08G074500 [Sorghum bicolor]